MRSFSLLHNAIQLGQYSCTITMSLCSCPYFSLWVLSSRSIVTANVRYDFHWEGAARLSSKDQTTQSMKSCASKRTSWYLRCYLQLLWKHLDKVLSVAYHCHGFRWIRNPRCPWIRNNKKPRQNQCLRNRRPLLNDKVQRSHCFHNVNFSVIEIRHQRTRCCTKCFLPGEVVFDLSRFDLRFLRIPTWHQSESHLFVQLYLFQEYNWPESSPHEWHDKLMLLSLTEREFFLE